MSELNNEFSSDETYIIVKAAPRASQKFGETVCIAGLNADGTWVRLYPVSFKHLEDAQRFGRWDKISYRWRKPSGVSDLRIESRRVDPNSVEIVGKLRSVERDSFLNPLVVTSLRRERERGNSLALLRPKILSFSIRKKASAEFEKEVETREQLRQQSDLFVREHVIPRQACPYSFVYHYWDDDGEHIGTCQDWETEATFFRRRSESSEQSALQWMQGMFGEVYPERGMALAMGTHRYRHDQWLINGVIRLNETSQMSLL